MDGDNERGDLKNHCYGKLPKVKEMCHVGEFSILEINNVRLSQRKEMGKSKVFSRFHLGAGRHGKSMCEGGHARISVVLIK